MPPAKNHKPVIGVLFGAGTHIEHLLAALRRLNVSLIVVQYHPSFTITYYNEKGEIVKTVRKKRIDFISKIYWFIKHRFYKPGGGKSWLLKLYNLYDRTSKPYVQHCTHLIAWPLISEQSMMAVKENKGFVLLEYPMIHITTWQTLVKNEYAKWKNTIQENVFTIAAENKILREIQVADSINVLSHFAKQTFEQENIPSHKITVLAPNLVSNPAEIRKKSYTKNRPVFLYAGRLDLNKGAQYLLEAFADLNIEHSQLIIAGRITDEFKPLSHHWMKQNKRITWMGHVERKKLEELYLSTDFLVVPSVQESYGMVIPEAMSHGITVLASDRTGAATLIKTGENGYIFESGNTEKLAQCMKEAIDKSPFDAALILQHLHRNHQSEDYAHGWKKLLALS